MGACVRVRVLVYFMSGNIMWPAVSDHWEIAGEWRLGGGGVIERHPYRIL